VRRPARDRRALAPETRAWILQPATGRSSAGRPLVHAQAEVSSRKEEFVTSALFRTEPEGQGAQAKVAAPEDDGARRPEEAGLSPRRSAQGRPAGPSVIGPGRESVGRVEVRDDLRIEGRIEGTVSVRGEVVVSDRGSVEGEIEADDIVIEGRMDGQLKARGSARFRSGCRMHGDVRSPVVELEEGGALDGRIEMSGEGPAPTGTKAAATGGAAAGRARGDAPGEEKQKEKKGEKAGD
jgi:cytoskeletal protein CcmA (bactofilin family)